MTNPVEKNDDRNGLTPRAPRENVFLGAVVERFGAREPTRHRVRDLSATGVRVDRAEALKPGSTVLVSVGSLAAVGATVVWVDKGVAGLKFVEPIDPVKARAKAIVRPAATPEPASGTPTGLGAGWAANLPDAYRK